VVRESRIKENKTRDINRNLITITTTSPHYQQSKPKPDPGAPNMNTAITTSTPHHRKKQTNEKMDLSHSHSTEPPHPPNTSKHTLKPKHRSAAKNPSPPH
jgi:hypothetical protein